MTDKTIAGTGEKEVHAMDVKSAARDSNISNASGAVQDDIIVDVNNLNFYYGTYHLLKSVNLYFKKNSV